MGPPLATCQSVKGPPALRPPCLFGTATYALRQVVAPLRNHPARQHCSTPTAFEATVLCFVRRLQTRLFRHGFPLLSRVADCFPFATLPLWQPVRFRFCDTLRPLHHRGSLLVAWWPRTSDPSAAPARPTLRTSARTLASGRILPLSGPLPMHLWSGSQFSPAISRPLAAKARRGPFKADSRGPAA